MTPTDYELWVEVAGSNWWGVKAHIDRKWATTMYHGDDPAWGQRGIGWDWV